MHTSPSRLTIAPHMRVPWKRPPASPPAAGAAMRNPFSALSSGSPWQRPIAAADSGVMCSTVTYKSMPTIVKTVADVTLRNVERRMTTSLDEPQLQASADDTTGYGSAAPRRLVRGADG